jgi:large-conductance mechanosensitive channel
MTVCIQTLPTPNLDNIKVDTFSPVQFIVLTSIVFLFIVAYAVFNTYQNSKSKTGYTRALQELTSLMQNINTHMDNANQYIAEIRRGVTKEGTYDQIREYALTKIISVMYKLKNAATDIKNQNHIAGNEKRIKGKVIDMVTNIYNNMCITFDLFLYCSKPLSHYLNENYIEEFSDVIFGYIYGENETEPGLERNLKIIIDKMYNEFSNSLINN